MARKYMSEMDEIKTKEERVQFTSKKDMINFINNMEEDIFTFSKICITTCIDLDCALPKDNCPDFFDDISPPSEEWKNMTDDQKQNYLDNELEEYMLYK
jgi:hypothetical protein